MTTLSYVTPEVPDFNYEFYTLTVHSGSAENDSRNTFTSYLTTPIKNVVQASLLGAHIHTLSSVEHIYVSVDELNSNFKDVGVFRRIGTDDEVPDRRNAFATLIMDANTHGNSEISFVYKNEYPNTTQYIRAIDIDKLTIRLLDENGNTLPPPTSEPVTSLIFRFVCKTSNIRPY